MGFELPKEITAKHAGLDALVDAEIAPRADKAGHQRLGLPKPCGGQAAAKLMISAGSRDVQMQRVAQYLFGLAGKQATQ